MVAATNIIDKLAPRFGSGDSVVRNYLTVAKFIDNYAPHSGSGTYSGRGGRGGWERGKGKEGGIPIFDNIRNNARARREPSF